MAAVRMALSVDDICDAQIEVEAYHRLQHLQGKHVPQLLGYGQSGQGFCVLPATFRCVKCTAGLLSYRSCNLMAPN